ncbi:glycosyltransferase [Paenibacillus sp. SI8]|uniref:tetratricopeptide repeat-containing glycosyltransferase family 2 protein n=1 Tax=unclassified Paenibacillus TaxID=185978 RepID=UPI003467BD19
MNKPLISLCMIVKNEQDVIARCLQSVKEAADEWIVIDTGSTDRTIDIARSEGASIHIRPWRHDFAAARNESIDLATGEWILVLDADESLEEGQGKQLRQIVENAPDTEGFFVRIVNYIGSETNNSGASSISSSLRLFRNKPAYRYVGRIHEQIVQPILSANPSAQLLYSNIQLNHGGYLPEIVQKKNKIKRNMELLQQELAYTDNESFHRYNLGVEYMRVGDYAKALEQFRLSRTVVDWRMTSFGHVVILRETNCLQALGLWEDAIELCSEASDALLDFPDLFLTIGRIHYHQRQWEQAETAFRRAIDIGEAPPQYTSASGAGTYSPSFHLGKTREQLEDYEGAINWYANALKFNSNLLSPFLRLISLLARLYDAKGITEKIETLFHLESPRTWWSIALSYYQLGLYEQAADILENKQLPLEKQDDRLLLLMRCGFLGPSILMAKESRIAAPRSQTNRKAFYTALSRNDDQTAIRCLRRMEKELKRKQRQKSLQQSPLEAAQESEASRELILHLHAHLLNEKKLDIPLHLPASAYSALWSELYFLYMLASKEHLFALQAQLQAFWRQILNLLPDPVQRLKGHYELIKTVHVRIYQLFQKEDDNFAYTALWNDVRPRLMTLIDDLFMEEVI